MRFTSFTREQLQEIKAVTLTLSDQFTAEQYNLLFTYLPGIQHLTIYSTRENLDTLGALLRAAHCLTLHYLAIFYKEATHVLRGFNSFNKREDNLPDELWQLTTLETLTINGFRYIYSISEDIGQLKALKSLMLDRVNLLNAPASLVQLNKLEALTLNYLFFITELPEDIGQLKALKSLMLVSMPSLKVLPASLGQLGKLEALTLSDVSITELPEDIGQLKALKSLELNALEINCLPTSIGQLSKLEALTLDDLRLTALPEEIGQLNALKVVKLINMGDLETLPGKLAQIVVKEKIAIGTL